MFELPFKIIAIDERMMLAWSLFFLHLARFRYKSRYRMGVGCSTKSYSLKLRKKCWLLLAVLWLRKIHILSRMKKTFEYLLNDVHRTCAIWVQNVNCAHVKMQFYVLIFQRLDWFWWCRCRYWRPLDKSG